MFRFWGKKKVKKDLHWKSIGIIVESNLNQTKQNEIT